MGKSRAVCHGMSGFERTAPRSLCLCQGQGARNCESLQENEGEAREREPLIICLGAGAMYLGHNFRIDWYNVLDMNHGTIDAIGDAIERSSLPTSDWGIRGLAWTLTKKSTLSGLSRPQLALGLPF